jgi:hypothetical protein
MLQLLRQISHRGNAVDLRSTLSQRTSASRGTRPVSAAPPTIRGSATTTSHLSLLYRWMMPSPCHANPQQAQPMSAAQAAKKTMSMISRGPSTGSTGSSKSSSSNILSLLAFLMSCLFALPAWAMTVSPGDLMYTDLFKWQGQFGTPTWRQIVDLYDCQPGFTFYLWHVPQAPAVIDIGDVGDNPPHVDTPPVVDPPPHIDPPPVTPHPTPETPTWLMLIMGFVAMAFVKKSTVCRVSRRCRPSPNRGLRTRP